MFKTLSPGSQVILFIFIVIMMSIVGEIFFALGLSVIVDRELLLQSDWGDVRMMMSRTLFAQVFTFLIAFLLFLRLTKEKFSSIVFIQSLKVRPILITIGVLGAGLLAMPILEMINEPLRHLLPSGFLEKEMATNAVQERIFYSDDPIQFGFVMIVMAVLPAICEELVFRGFLIKKMMSSGMAETGAIFMSAALFAISHMQPLKFLPMFFMGICLGFVYMRFKNIKYSMLLHFLFNGIQITIAFLIASDVLDFEF